ncbi:hypothetical protein CRG98_038685 [Punica granatum]|uniref:Uncharacterized protein n=1 Tax=Punica granatum TaxID=22663 RepID=A0A2I0IB73_PUNGR|nr:hypothetical protein CRG98_038685 [Punica granatum]
MNYSLQGIFATITYAAASMRCNTSLLAAMLDKSFELAALNKLLHILFQDLFVLNVVYPSFMVLAILVRKFSYVPHFIHLWRFCEPELLDFMEGRESLRLWRWAWLRSSVTSKVFISLLSHTFILTQKRLFKGYELLGTNCKNNKVPRRCNDETLFGPPFLRPLWKVDITSRGVGFFISVATLKKRSHHARSVSPSLCSMVNSSLKSRFTHRVTTNLWMNNSYNCSKVVIKPRASE